ncbi:MAG: hypothetical protein RLZZ546_2976 [Bacteroidota bacterium]|jgi:gliding motility-associated protein GldC
MSSTSTITIKIQLDKNKHPESIVWNASDNPEGNKDIECKAMMLSLFEKVHLDTFKLDLWTKEMQIAEMDRFVFQSLRALADSYYQATKNADLANAMRSFVDYFGENTGILVPEKE